MNELKTGLFKLIPKDILKAAIVAAITTVGGIIYTAINNGAVPSTLGEWKHIAIAGCGSFFAYLMKNFLTNDKDQFLKKDSTI